MTNSPYKKNFGLPDSVIDSVKAVLSKPKPVVETVEKPKVKYDLNGKPVIMEEVEQIDEKNKSLGSSMKKFKRVTGRDPRSVKDDTDTLTHKTLNWVTGERKGPLVGAAELQRRLAARKLTKQGVSKNYPNGKLTKRPVNNAESYEIEEVELDEGRGRPRKTPLAAGETEGNEPDQNIIMQLRKAVSMKGIKPVKFQNGESHTISPAKAIAVLRIHAGLKSSIEKGNFEKKLAHSHDSFLTHSAPGANHGAAPEKKSRITLPAVNRLKLRKPIDESTNDDGYIPVGSSKKAIYFHEKLPNHDELMKRWNVQYRKLEKGKKPKGHSSGDHEYSSYNLNQHQVDVMHKSGMFSGASPEHKPNIKTLSRYER